MNALNIRVAFSAIDKFTRPVNAARQSAGGLSDSIKKTQAAIKSLDSQASAFQKLRASTNDTAQKLNRAQREAGGLSQRLKETGTLTDAQRAHLDALNSRISRLSATYSKQTTKLKESAAALRQHGVTLTSGSGTIMSAIRRTEQYNKTLEKERRQLAAVTQARARYDKMQATASSLRTGGAGAMIGAVGAGYAAGRFLSPSIGFDAEMSRVQALTRLNKNDGGLSELREQAKKLGAETAFSSTDAASGQAYLAMAGFTPDAIKAALPGVLNMALAGGMELGESSDIGSNILSQFKLDPGEMDRVSDTLTATFTRSNTDLRALGETMKYAGPVAASLGVSLEDAAAMAGILANNGLRGSDAGTAMRKSLSSLASPTKRAREALKELGVSAADSSGKMRPTEDILLDLYKATQKYGDVDQVSFFKDIAGEEAFVALQTLIQGAGDGSLQKLTKELKKSGGEAEAVAKKMADNLSGDLKELDSAWEGLRITIGELVDGPLRSLAQWLSTVINLVSNWAKENPKLASTLLVIAGSVGALTAAVGATSLAAGVLLGPLSKLQLGFALLTGGKGIGGVLGMLGGLGRGLLSLGSVGFGGLASIASGSFSAIASAAGLLFTPIGLIGLAIVAAGLLIWRYWEPIKAWFSGFFSGLIQGLEPVRQSFSRLTPIFDAIASAVSACWDWFTQLLTPVKSSQEELDKCAAAGQTFGQTLGNALTMLLTPLTTLMDGIGWILEKLELIPSGIDAAQQKANSLKTPTAYVWDEKQKKMVPQTWDWSKDKKDDKGKPGTPNTPPPLGGDRETQRRLRDIANNTGGALNEMKKRIGPGDIVFKNLPRATAVRGAWQEARGAAQQLPKTTQKQQAKQLEVSAPVTQPLTRNDSTPIAASGSGPVININFYDTGKHNPRELAAMVEQTVIKVYADMERRARSSFRDKN